MRIVIKAKQPGFTLLEVLLGMSIMSIMMLLLFASLRICVQNWNAGEKKIAQVSQAAIVQGFLQNKLQAALPLDADFFEEEQFSFQGDKEKMQFVAAMPASASRLGLQLFNISMKKSVGEDGHELLVDIQPFFPQGDDAEQWKEEQVVILKKIDTLRFAYFGPDSDDTKIGDSDEDSAWQNEWLERKALPRLVRIDVELINGEVWPQLVIALKINSALGATGKGGSSMGGRGGAFTSGEL
ncbi:MAG: prepilin-type N-terminal cleavage/methylation domain-containing protein [Methyloprofundus sp.]|nr:prepilin-type N-terminal cleavage/methylation domain-containing protein [Methyloprofundus sp.]